MESRNADEVRDAGAVEGTPLHFGNRALVADGQRDDHSRVRRIGQRRKNARPDPFARAEHEIRRAAGERVLSPVALVVAHVAGRANPVFEEPRFDVEAVRVDRAVRPLQTNDELPPFSGGDRRHGIRDAAFWHLRIPGERQPRGNDRVAGQRALDGEGESRAARGRLRQVVDDADDRNVLALPLRGQRIGEAHFCPAGGVAEAEHSRGQHGKHRGDGASKRNRTRQCHDTPSAGDGSGGGAKPHEALRQFRLPLQQQHACREREQHKKANRWQRRHGSARATRSLDDTAATRRKAGAKMRHRAQTWLIYGGSVANCIARMV